MDTTVYVEGKTIDIGKDTYLGYADLHAKEYEDFCMCKSHNGKPPSYLCTIAIGHSGPHVAHGSENIVCAIWR